MALFSLASIEEAKENINQLSRAIMKLVREKNKLEEKEERLAESSEMQSQLMSDEFKQFFNSRKVFLWH